MIKCKFLFLATLVSLVTLSSLQVDADVVLSSGFDGNTGAFVFGGNTDNTSGSATLAINDWTLGAGVTSATGLTAISTGDSGTLGGFAQTQNGGGTYASGDVVFLSRNLNLDSDRTTSQRGYSFEFTVDTTIELENLLVLSGHTNNAGNQDQAFTSDLFYELSGGSLVAPVTASSNEDYGIAPDYHEVDFDLTGTTLEAGTYSLSIWQSNMPGGGAYATYNGLTLNSVNAIPEPASGLLVTVMLCGIAICRRRNV